MSMHRSVMGRGVVSDNAKKLSEVIDRVQRSEAVSHKVTDTSSICECPKCGYVMHITTEQNLPEKWKQYVQHHYPLKNSS